MPKGVEPGVLCVLHGLTPVVEHHLAVRILDDVTDACRDLHRHPAPVDDVAVVLDMASPVREHQAERAPSQPGTLSRHHRGPAVAVRIAPARPFPPRRAAVQGMPAEIRRRAKTINFGIIYGRGPAIPRPLHSAD